MSFEMQGIKTHTRKAIREFQVVKFLSSWDSSSQGGFSSCSESQSTNVLFAFSVKLRDTGAVSLCIRLSIAAQPFFACAACAFQSPFVIALLFKLFSGFFSSRGRVFKRKAPSKDLCA